MFYYLKALYINTASKLHLLVTKLPYNKNLKAVINSYNRTIDKYKETIVDQAKVIQMQSNTLRKLKITNEQFSDMLANKNAKCVEAQQIYVTKHALYRYRTRIGFSGTDDELRKLIYKGLLKHLATMDVLEDGHYKLNSKAAARVRDKTVQTIVPARRKQS